MVPARSFLWVYGTVKNKDTELLTREALDSPLIKELRDLAYVHCGVSFVIVFPEESGWGQVTPQKKQQAPEFCQLVWQTKDGIKQCRMCHILMSVAACSQGVTEQRCHAGASVLVMPIADKGESSFSLLSSCLFKPDSEKEASAGVKAKGRLLGANTEEMEQAFHNLPSLSNEKRDKALVIMRLLREVIRELSLRMGLEKRLKEMAEALSAKNSVSRAVSHELKTALDVPTDTVPGPQSDKAQRLPALSSKTSSVVETVAAMIRDRPHMAFSVADIASAARMTPNHFSTLFHRHKAQSFSRYLTEQRIELAKRLLRDQTLNIQEVATKCGYGDPGYFTRRFRQETRMTPREWRNTIHQDHQNSLRYAPARGDKKVRGSVAATKSNSP
mgnify:CR=1 FL=1